MNGGDRQQGPCRSPEAAPVRSLGQLNDRSGRLGAPRTLVHRSPQADDRRVRGSVAAGCFG